MVGFQPYSNTKTRRKNYRRKRTFMPIMRFYLWSICIIIFIFIGFLFISNEKFTITVLRKVSEITQEFEEPKGNKFNGKTYNEYLITETP